jgi:hypothetical protein
MGESRGRSRWGTFLLGGLIGGLAGVAATHLRARPRARAALTSPGLAAFEAAPCFQELAEAEGEFGTGAAAGGRTV